MGGKWNPRFDMPDLHGKIAVVTGSSSGIGLQTTKHLAQHGAKVYFTARTESKATNTIDSIVSQNPEIPDSQLVWLQLDLTSMESVLQATRVLKAKETKIDILINNAGGFSGQDEKTEAGWEMAMTICHVGHFVFTHEILPLLKHATTEHDSDVRIVTVASALHHSILPANYPIDFTSPSFLHVSQDKPWLWHYILRHFFTVDLINYSVAKLANVLFAQELQRRLEKEGVPAISMSVHPGSINTPGALNILVPWARPLARMVMDDDDTGSRNTLFAATATEVRQDMSKYQGSYIEPVGRLHDKHPICKDENQARGLWETTFEEVNLYLVKHGYPPLAETSIPFD